ncbi:hypothetical protein HUU39_05550 [candidate division KSB1 bacterium]|nr:Rdx family protein [bacterium]NUM64726.1 hypothetical protein [candidate division KSB1 bacterium]
MEREIRSHFPQAAVELIEGSHGIFDVKQDGRLLYSKHDTGRFPQSREILMKLK